MCGIAGLIDSKISREERAAILERMLHIQHHRGPDATGSLHFDTCALGHNRLSIIDLSAAANQPMLFDNLAITYNGEVYNYVELGEELKALGHTFQTHSDTEIILHAYRQWGDACVERFVGMWAFAIYDEKRQRLFISRDRFGIKPLYYINDGGRFYFASEIKTLKKTPVFKNDLNLNQVARGLQMGWLSYNDETYFEKVKALPAAHNLVVEQGRVTVSRYWDVMTSNRFTGSFDEKCRRFDELFRESIRIHLRSDVPVASCLSGGLDSSAIVSMVQQLHPGLPYKSFSIYYDGDGDVDERPFIREVIKKYPTVEPVYFNPADSDVEAHFTRALYHADVPVSGSSFMSQYFLMKLIREGGIKVVLDGQGADEYLGGYMHSFYRLVAGMIHAVHPVKALKTELQVNRRLANTFKASVAHAGKSLIASVCTEQTLYEMEYRNYNPFLTSAQKHPVPFTLPKKEGTKLTSFLYNLLFTTSLPSLLQYEDRNSMAFSVESRVPFLDHRLVEFCFALADDDKIHDLETKYILREALEPVLPQAIYRRKDKKGFVTPGENKWLRGPLAHLLESRPQDLPFIRKAETEHIFKDYKSGNNKYATLVWRLAVLGEWMKSV
ncbi:MAG TPA: asparagine synthase (glutamine-hydrolyzing) [Bacteroidia bacterium]|nr:asparagine synthase (glutamine-hydrolyzing) [Bacteroidia bacterium]